MFVSMHVCLIITKPRVPLLLHSQNLVFVFEKKVFKDCFKNRIVCENVFSYNVSGL